MPLMEKLSSFARRAPLGVAYMADVPYFVGRLTGTTVRESLAVLANSLASSAGHRIRRGRGPEVRSKPASPPCARTSKSRSECGLLCQESSIDHERQYYFSKRRTHR